MKSTITRQFLTTIIIVFCLMFLMVSYILSSYYYNSVANINDLGNSNMKCEAAMLESHLNKGIDILMVTAYTVENMMAHGETSDKILQYLTEETEYGINQIDKNFTGIYGYISGEYFDGSGWNPPSDYKPIESDWYQDAKEAGGKPVIVASCQDSEMGNTLISVSMLLADGKSVVSLDISLDEVQSITENMMGEDNGYAFVLDNTGLVIAHSDKTEEGKIYAVNDEKRHMLSKIYDNESSCFEVTIEGERCTVFSNQVMADWYVVMVVSNTKLFHDLRRQMAIGIFLSVFAFSIIVVFCAVSAKRINKYQHREQESREKLDRMNTNTIRALAYTIDAKDRYTSGHSQRVADYSLAIAKRMGKSEEEQNIVYYAGLLHDVGKIRVSEEVINKPGKLTEEDFNQIRVHPVSGYHILKDIYGDAGIAYGAKYHHERYDGNGYPNGLEGENIPEIARIIGVADAYDAMASNRSYRDALPQDVVRSEIEKGRGSQFDEKIADIMLQMIDEDKDYSMCQSEKSMKNILVVDDEIMNIKLVERILKDVPYFHVIGVKTKEETFAALSANEIHLILLDLIMPDVDGFELYQMIREKYSMPVVLMTADKSIETVHKISELGISDYLTKPLHSFVVKETVHGIVNSWG